MYREERRGGSIEGFFSQGFLLGRFWGWDSDLSLRERSKIPSFCILSMFSLILWSLNCSYPETSSLFFWVRSLLLCLAIVVSLSLSFSLQKCAGQYHLAVGNGGTFYLFFLFQNKWREEPALGGKLLWMFIGKITKTQKNNGPTLVTIEL